MAITAGNYLAIVAFILCATSAWSEPVSSGLLNDLRQGGYVLVMRHASSPATPPDRSAADRENPGLERQLDEKGRTAARDMGRAFRSLRISVGRIYSSPTYRALETIKLAEFGSPVTEVELGDQGQSMGHLKGPGPAAWLRTKVTERPAGRRNTMIVTHMPNITAAFPKDAAGLADGETLIFKPDGRGHAALVAKIPIEDWNDGVP